ncbi:uncharacterized protein LOC106065253 isoform X2 [Biomphalaria glabrata]|uniref:Uncharacterized protein LOC106065253 isoform X2 n=1 Tax=Biomphalaria glabrata TaxID=6526 RepID=A0A9W2YDS6_BIOGL|nr:uncharacterized protein LOC106065253 isoform X2 [Biomphalaria glabrata]
MTDSCAPTLLDRLLNFTLAYLWVGPLVTVYWYNSWSLPDNYLFPSHPVTSSWISGAIGYTIFFLGYLLQDPMSAFTVRQNKLVQGVILEVYTYVMCWGNVNQWRCVWVLLDEYTGVFLLNAALTTVFASLLLLLLRAHRTIASTPSTVRMDIPVKDHFKMNTLFDISGGYWFKAADAIFTAIFVDSVGIAVWRGVWEVMDLALTPDDKTMSGVWSLVISYSLAILLCLTQDLVKKISIRLETRHWLVALAFEDCVTLLHSTVTVCHWRGFWTLMSIYLPFKPLSHWVCHIGSFTLLAVGMAATSIPVLGLMRDGRLQKGEGVVFDNFYFTHMKKLLAMIKSPRLMSLQKSTKT